VWQFCRFHLAWFFSLERYSLSQVLSLTFSARILIAFGLYGCYSQLLSTAVCNRTGNHYRLLLPRFLLIPCPFMRKSENASNAEEIFLPQRVVLRRAVETYMIIWNIILRPKSVLRWIIFEFKIYMLESWRKVKNRWIPIGFLRQLYYQKITEKLLSGVVLRANFR